MADAHNGVAYEYSDVSPRPLVVAGVAFVVFMAVTLLGLWWFNEALFGEENAIKATDLPPAAVGPTEPPEPRLEEIEDVRAGRTGLWPERAEQYAAPRRKELDKGDEKTGAVPIQEALRALPGLLPAQKGPTPGAYYGRRLPSKAASGRVETGGE
jgi:hypothetical protein